MKKPSWKREQKNDFDRIIGEMDYEKITEKKFKSLNTNLCKMEEIKLDLPTFKNFFGGGTKKMKFCRTLSFRF